MMVTHKNTCKVCYTNIISITLNQRRLKTLSGFIKRILSYFVYHDKEQPMESVSQRQGNL